MEILNHIKAKAVFYAVIYSILWMANGYCQEMSYDNDETHKVVQQKCKTLYKKMYSGVQYEDKNEYNEIIDRETRQCECEVYAAYHVFGPKFMDDLLNKGYSYRTAVERAGVLSLQKHGVTKLNQYEALTSKCRGK